MSLCKEKIIRSPVFFFLCLFSLLVGQPLFSGEVACRRVLFIMTRLELGGAELSFISLINGWSIPNTSVDILLKGRGGLSEHRLRKDFPIISTKSAMVPGNFAAILRDPFGGSPASIAPNQAQPQSHAPSRLAFVHLECPSGAIPRKAAQTNYSCF